MIIEYVGVKEINGSLIAIDGIKNASFEEMVTIRLANGSERTGRIVQMPSLIHIFFPSLCFSPAASVSIIGK